MSDHSNLWQFFPHIFSDVFYQMGQGGEGVGGLAELQQLTKKDGYVMLGKHEYQLQELAVSWQQTIFLPTDLTDYD